MKRLVLILTICCPLAGTALAVEPWAALPEVAPSPAINPATPAKVALGRLLFHDKRLSESSTVSCASCHNLAEGGADHQPLSTGVHNEHNPRNTPTVWNVGFMTSYYWDGRASSLEAQAMSQLLNPLDMGMKDEAYVTARLRSIGGYQRYFTDAFGAADAVTAENAVRAIAAFERSLVNGDAPYDRFVHGDRSALSEQQVRGMELFRSAGCSRCHQGAAFVGPSLQAGSVFTMKFPTHPLSPYVASYDLARDRGRFEWTSREQDRYQWRVPTLRNLVYTAPYMHNGSVPTLAHAVRTMGSTELERTFTDAETDDIVAFLKALSGPLPAQSVPTLP
jgi:cytochrome c peroxidase